MKPKTGNRPDEGSEDGSRGSNNLNGMPQYEEVYEDVVSDEDDDNEDNEAFEPFPSRMEIPDEDMNDEDDDDEMLLDQEHAYEQDAAGAYVL